VIIRQGFHFFIFYVCRSVIDMNPFISNFCEDCVTRDEVLILNQFGGLLQMLVLFLLNRCLVFGGNK